MSNGGGADDSLAASACASCACVCVCVCVCLCVCTLLYKCLHSIRFKNTLKYWAPRHKKNLGLRVKHENSVGLAWVKWMANKRKINVKAPQRQQNKTVCGCVSTNRIPAQSMLTGVHGAVLECCALLTSCVYFYTAGGKCVSAVRIEDPPSCHLDT